MYVHVNALNPRSQAEAQRGSTHRETLQKDVNAIRSAGGVAQINHPNFFWQLTADDIVATHGAQLMEIMNMHPTVNTFGAGPDTPSAEEIWDQALSRGLVIWGVASDDEHQLLESGSGEPVDPGRGALPGRGWIVVRAPYLTTEEIMKAIDKGDFYASTGVELEDYQVNTKQITIKIKAEGPFRIKYRVQFIGKNGRILQDDSTNPTTYTTRGDESYVRARITDSNGRMAWTQPVFLH
jgi:hypothetical protein